MSLYVRPPRLPSPVPSQNESVVPPVKTGTTGEYPTHWKSTRFLGWDTFPEIICDPFCVFVHFSRKTFKGHIDPSDNLWLLSCRSNFLCLFYGSPTSVTFYTTRHKYDMFNVYHSKCTGHFPNIKNKRISILNENISNIVPYCLWNHSQRSSVTSVHCVTHSVQPSPLHRSEFMYHNPVTSLSFLLGRSCVRPSSSVPYRCYRLYFNGSLPCKLLFLVLLYHGPILRLRHVSD